MGGRDEGLGGGVERGVGRGRGRGGGEEMVAAEAVDVGDEINAIKDGAREAFTVGGDLSGATGTGMVGVAIVAAGAGVHGSDEDKVGGIGGVLVGAGKGDLPILKGLAESFKNVARIFGQLVKEEDATVGEGDFAGLKPVASTEDSSGAGGVMRGAEGALSKIVVRLGGKGMELGDFNLF